MAGSEDLNKMARELLQQVEAGIEKWGVVQSEEGPIYAYEVPSAATLSAITCGSATDLSAFTLHRWMAWAASSRTSTTLTSPASSASP